MNTEDQNIRDAGLKVTLPRVKILQIMEQAAETQSQHLSAEDVYKQLLTNGADIGLATVYRVLTQFESAGLVVRHHFSEGHSVFELARGSHHDHMICLDSGDVLEFCDERIETLQRELVEAKGYELVDHSLVLYVRPKKPS